MSDSTKAPSASTSSARGVDGATASERVVAAVAEAEGIAPVDVEPPLYAAVDPDALDVVVETLDGDASGHPGTVDFRYGGYDVVVSGDGTVAVAPSPDV